MTNTSQNMRILIIDDNPSLVRVFVKFLQIRGFFVTGETTLEAGLKHLENELYHVVFVDVPLDDYDGKQILSMLQESQAFQKTAVFLFSGVDFDSIELDKWKKHGLYSYLKKPINRNVIIKELSDMHTKIVFSNKSISNPEDEETATEQLTRLEQIQKRIQKLESLSESIVEDEKKLLTH